MRKILILSFCFMLLFASTAQAEMSVAVFNLQDVANKSDALKAAKAKMQKEYDGKKKELDAKRAKVEKLVTAMGNSPTKEQQTEFMRIKDEYNEAANLYVQNIRKAEMDIREKIDAIIIQAAQNLGKEKNYDLILDTTAAIYFKSTMDVTNDMLTQVNKVWKTK